MVLINTHEPTHSLPKSFNYGGLSLCVGEGWRCITTELMSGLTIIFLSSMHKFDLKNKNSGPICFIFIFGNQQVGRVMVPPP